MIFPYSTLVVAAPDASDEYLVVYRPETPATFSGSMGSAAYLGLVDTVSDNTIVPKSIADDLGIATYETSEPAASVFGGYQVRLLAGEVVICLKAGEEEIPWRAEAHFFDFPSKAEETIILGHVGFLEYFTAIFDGKEATLSLTPNDELPVVELQ